MIARELFVFVAAVAAFSSAVAAYLAAFHGAATLKETLSTAFAAVVGLYVGRFVERRLING